MLRKSVYLKPKCLLFLVLPTRSLLVDHLLLSHAQ